MPDLEPFGKLLILFGLICVALGALMVGVKYLPFIGKLPGDIIVQKKNFTFYFPVTTSILLSLIISIILYLFNKK